MLTHKNVCIIPPLSRLGNLCAKGGRKIVRARRGLWLWNREDAHKNLQVLTTWTRPAHAQCSHEVAPWAKEFLAFDCGWVRKSVFLRRVTLVTLTTLRGSPHTQERQANANWALRFIFIFGRERAWSWVGREVGKDLQGVGVWEWLWPQNIYHEALKE